MSDKWNGKGKNSKDSDVDNIKLFQGIAFAGGKAESGETIYDSAIREFREEAGLLLSNLQCKGFYYCEGVDDY